jgi:hypothetical protein
MGRKDRTKEDDSILSNSVLDLVAKGREDNAYDRGHQIIICESTKDIESDGYYENDVESNESTPEVEECDSDVSCESLDEEYIDEENLDGVQSDKDSNVAIEESDFSQEHEDSGEVMSETFERCDSNIANEESDFYQEHEDAGEAMSETFERCDSNIVNENLQEQYCGEESLVGLQNEKNGPSVGDMGIEVNSDLNCSNGKLFKLGLVEKGELPLGSNRLGIYQTIQRQLKNIIFTNYLTSMVFVIFD